MKTRHDRGPQEIDYLDHCPSSPSGRFAAVRSLFYLTLVIGWLVFACTWDWSAFDAPLVQTSVGQLMDTGVKLAGALLVLGLLLGVWLKPDKNFQLSYGTWLLVPTGLILLYFFHLQTLLALVGVAFMAFTLLIVLLVFLQRKGYWKPAKRGSHSID
jgi:hypothetical protein